MHDQRQDARELEAFLHTLGRRGVQLVTTGARACLAATALLGKALKRAGVPLSGLTTASLGLSLDEPEARAVLHTAPALLVVGAGRGGRRLPEAVPQLIIDGAPDEPLVARALRLAGTLGAGDELAWVAALGLVQDQRQHPIVARATAQHRRADLVHVAELLDAAGRSPMPGMMSVMAMELLMAAPDPVRFLAAEPCELLRKCQAIVTAELGQATRVRPRAGHAAVLVVEYDSACRLEDWVAARWRGLKAGTVVLVANHGWVEGRVAVVARCGSPETLAQLCLPLGAGDAALLSLGAWADLLARLGVPPALLKARGTQHELELLATMPGTPPLVN
jgi:hypothetical protein